MRFLNWLSTTAALLLWAWIAVCLLSVVVVFAVAVL